MKEETHTYQVSVWLPGTNNPGSLFERGYWVEMCRCVTKSRAEEIARALSHAGHPDGVQVAELVSDEKGVRFAGYLFLPESAKGLSGYSPCKNELPNKP